MPRRGRLSITKTFIKATFTSLTYGTTSTSKNEENYVLDSYLYVSISEASEHGQSKRACWHHLRNSRVKTLGILVSHHEFIFLETYEAKMTSASGRVLTLETL